MAFCLLNTTEPHLWQYLREFRWDYYSISHPMWHAARYLVELLYSNFRHRSNLCHFSCFSPSVVSVSETSCLRCEAMKVTEPSEGIIASVTTKETRCGSEGCPWLIEAGIGQQVNITLLDFSYEGTGDDSHESNPAVCPVYAIIKVGWE